MTQSSRPSLAATRNAAYSSSAWVVAVGVSLLATPFIVKQLSIEGYGVYALLTGVVGYVNLLDFGLGQGVVKFVAEHEGADAAESQVDSLNAGLLLQVPIGIGLAVIAMLVAGPLLRLLRVPSDYWVDALTGIRLASVVFAFTLVSGTLAASLMGLQRFDITSKVDAGSNVLLTVCIVTVLQLGMGLRQVMWVHVVVSGTTMLVYGLLVKRALPRWRPTVRIPLRTFRQLTSFSAYVFVSRLASVFNRYAVRFIIAAVTGPVGVTLYAVPMKMVAAVGGGMSNLTAVLLPYASHMSAARRHAELGSAYVKTFRYSTAIALPLYLCLGLLPKEILTVWMGPEFGRAAAPVLLFLSGAYLVSALTMTPANFALGLGRSRLVAGFGIVVVIVGLLLVWPLTEAYGARGAAAGVMIGSLQGLVMIGYITWQVAHGSAREVFREVAFFHAPAGVLIVLAIAAARGVIELGYAPVLVGAISVIVCCYYLAYLAAHPDARTLLRGVVASVMS